MREPTITFLLVKMTPCERRPYASYEFLKQHTELEKNCKYKCIHFQEPKKRERKRKDERGREREKERERMREEESERCSGCY